MRNTWLVIRREYVERVRSRAFLLFTVLMPLLVAGLVVVPGKLIAMKSGGTRHIVVVTSNPQLGNEFQQQLASADTTRDADGDPEEGGIKYRVEVNDSPTEDSRRKLTAEVGAGTLDGYLWLSPEAIQSRKFVYTTRNSSDFIETSTVRNAVSRTLTIGQLAEHGVSSDQATKLLKPVSMETVRVENGKARRSTSMTAFLLPILLMMMIYMTVLIYGIAVMRSVLEEKSTRIIEVLLSSITARQLMAGKILGVGAVGLTQILIWAVLGGIASAPTMIAARPYLADLRMPLGVYFFFPTFFVLGYMLYSTLYATLASMVNSEEEAQQLQWPVIMPLILCTVFASAVIRQPNSSLAFWTSLFPLTSPIIMFVRIIVRPETPAWQIALCISILLGTIYGLVLLCSRIYRVGILMYGKRPTLPEIMKWIKYAG